MLYFLNVPLTRENGERFLHQFQCQRCGKCCQLKGGQRILPEELDSLAQFLKLSTHQFKEKYTFTQAGNRFINTPCPFLRFEPGSTGCSIYYQRPEVCRQFPFNTPWIKDGQPYLTVEGCQGGKALGEQYGFIPTQKIIYGEKGLYLVGDNGHAK